MIFHNIQTGEPGRAWTYEAKNLRSIKCKDDAVRRRWVVSKRAGRCNCPCVSVKLPFFGKIKNFANAGGFKSPGTLGNPT
jgi:hypothetical protein